MRDPNRIAPMLEQIQAYWLAHPDLRFWQVVEFMRTRLSDCPDFDPFYTEDEKTAELLDRMVNNV